MWQQSEIGSVEEMKQVARKLVAMIPQEGTVCFHGEMGVGKTTLINAICAELGVIDHTTSPTFSIVNEYRTHQGQKIYHFDLYRIQDEEELFDLGLEDYFTSEALLFIEWPELAESLLPAKAVHVTIELIENNYRTVKLGQVHA